MSERPKSIAEMATEKMFEINRKPAEDRLKQPGDTPSLDLLIPDLTPRPDDQDSNS